MRDFVRKFHSISFGRVLREACLAKLITSRNRTPTLGKSQPMNAMRKTHIGGAEPNER
jgi:hypothetical protein